MTSIDELYSDHPELYSAEHEAEHRVEGRLGILDLVQPGTVGAEARGLHGSLRGGDPRDGPPGRPPPRRPLVARLRRPLPRLGGIHGGRHAADTRRPRRRRGESERNPRRVQPADPRGQFGRLAAHTPGQLARLGVCRLDARLPRYTRRASPAPRQAASGRHRSRRRLAAGAEQRAPRRLPRRPRARPRRHVGRHPRRRAPSVGDWPAAEYSRAERYRQAFGARVNRLLRR